MENKRDDTRVVINRPILLQEFTYDNEYEKLDSPITAEIVDLSSSGALVKTNLDLPIGSCFYLKLALQNENVPIIFNVIRKDKAEEPSYIYGCDFLNINESIESKLRKFIFAEQIKIHNMNKKRA
ncbi:MAG: PilZ domain [Firmicutes bacterium]|nr:PilZ domain [Bacillota bacterium]